MLIVEDINMSDPLNYPAREQQNRAALDDLNPHQLEPAEEDLLAYKQEPLFNKKVMIAWAGFALAVWFVMSFVVPAAMQSAKSAIREAVREAETTTGPNGTTKVIILPNGKRITIRTDNPADAGTAAPAATEATPPAPAQPAALPAPVAAPAPAAKK